MQTPFLLYKNANNQVKVDVLLEDETICLSQAQICGVLQKSKSTISEHITHIFEEEELLERAVIRNFRTTARNDELGYNNPTEE